MAPKKDTQSFRGNIDVIFFPNFAPGNFANVLPMSFLATPTSRLFIAAASRRYASSAAAGAKKSSSLPLYFLGAGAFGMAGYWYLDYQTKASAKLKQEKSPLDPENFLDFKLKKIEPYNHNTSKCVYLRRPRVIMNAHVLILKVHI